MVDEYFLNGMNRGKAYESVYDARGVHAQRGCYKLFKQPHVQEYYKRVQGAYALSVGLNKDAIILNLMQDLEANDKMTALALKDNLTEKEQQTFERLSKVLSQTGKVATINTICKIIGAFEPEKVQVEVVNYTIGFGE